MDPRTPPGFSNRPRVPHPPFPVAAAQPRCTDPLARHSHRRRTGCLLPLRGPRGTTALPGHRPSRCGGGVVGGGSSAPLHKGLRQGARPRSYPAAPPVHAAAAAQRPVRSPLPRAPGERREPGPRRAASAEPCRARRRGDGSDRARPGRRRRYIAASRMTALFTPGRRVPRRRRGGGGGRGGQPPR